MMFFPCRCCGDDTIDDDDDDSSRSCRFGDVSHTVPRGFYIDGPAFDNPKLLHRDYAGEKIYVELQSLDQPCQGYFSEIMFFGSKTDDRYTTSGHISKSSLHNKIKISSFYYTKTFLSSKNNFNSIDEVPQNYISKNLDEITLVFSDNELENLIGYVLTQPNADGDYLLPEEILGYLLEIECVANGDVTQPDSFLGEIHYANENIFSKKTLMSDFDEVLSGSEDGVSWQAQHLFSGDTSQVLFSQNMLGQENEISVFNTWANQYAEQGYPAAVYKLGYHPFLANTQQYVSGIETGSNEILTNFQITIPDLSGNALSEIQKHMLQLAAGSYTMPFGIVQNKFSIETGIITDCCEEFGRGTQPNQDHILFCDVNQPRTTSQTHEGLNGSFQKNAAVAMYNGLSIESDDPSVEPYIMHPAFRESDGTPYAGFDYPIGENGEPLLPKNSETGEVLTAENMTCRQKFGRRATLRMNSQYSFLKTGNHKAPDGSYHFLGRGLPETTPAVKIGFELISQYTAYYNFGWNNDSTPLFYMTTLLLGNDEVDQFITITADQRQSGYGLNTSLAVNCQLFVVKEFTPCGPYSCPVYENTPFTATFGPSNPLP